jgi:hypothetical protein
MSIWDTPYQDLPWYHRIYVQPIVMVLEGINWLLRKFTTKLK